MIDIYKLLAKEVILLCFFINNVRVATSPHGDLWKNSSQSDEWKYLIFNSHFFYGLWWASFQMFKSHFHFLSKTRFLFLSWKYSKCFSFNLNLWVVFPHTYIWRGYQKIRKPLEPRSVFSGFLQCVTNYFLRNWFVKTLASKNISGFCGKLILTGCLFLKWLKK